MANAPLNVTDLEFQGIRNNLKAWMEANPAFTDYDFEASGLSFLLDALAYNTHYNAVLANFMANEMFLDSSLKRSSVLSHAKALGYRPRGFVASKATVDISITATTGGTPPAQFILRRGTPFNTMIGNTYYQFVTTKDYVASLVGSEYAFTNVELVEGVFNTYAWKASANVYEKYLIPNVRTDISTIVMHIYTDTNSSDFVEWTRAANAFNVLSDSTVFFTQETEKQYTEFYFGNDVVGAKPAANSVIKIEYVSCNGEEGNGAKLFSPAGNLTHDNGSVIASTYTITLVQESYGGANAETVNEIKYNASNHFAVQNRAVTTYDYVDLIREGFTNLEDIKVWGGETAAQKQYGTVFICIKPNTGQFLTLQEKTDITNLLKNKTLMGTKLRFVDPEYIDVVVDTKVKYDLDKKESTADLAAIITNEILNYSDNTLESFNAAFRYSNLLGVIDNAHKSIINNQTTVKMYKAAIPVLGVETNYVLNFYNEIAVGDDVIDSTLFFTPESPNEVRLKNRGETVVMGYYNQTGNFVIVREVGTLDFINGIIRINGINVLSYQGDETKITAIPAYTDIYSNENNILRIRTQDITVTVESESVR